VDSYRYSIEKAIAYIENHLKKPLNVEEVAKHVNISYYHFHRTFYALTGETLGDYIRKRRLTQAACELLASDRRIIDIAIDYEFKSQEAFSRSFKNVYGMSPGSFRKKGVPPIISEKNTLLGKRLNHRMKKISISPEIIYIDEPIKIIGFKGKTSIANNRIPELWSEFRENVSRIPNVLNHAVSYGICLVSRDFNLHELTKFTSYYELVGLEVTNLDIIPEGMSGHYIKAGHYAIFTHQGRVMQLRNTYDYIWGTWIPNADYEIDLRDDFEVYGEDFYGPEDDKSIIRIYLPIKQPKCCLKYKDSRGI